MATKPMSTLQLPNSADVYEITDKKARDEKIDKDQGTENAGKIFAVGTDGKAAIVTAPTVFDATYDETNEVLVLGGKSEIPGNVSVDPTLSETSVNAIQNQAVAKKVNELSSRMNTFTSLEEGSTTGDAELQDIRVGYDGTTYENAGEAVRQQISELKGEMENSKIQAVE